MTMTQLESKVLSDLGNMKHAKMVVLDIEGNTKDVRADPESLTVGLSYAFRSNGSSSPISSGYIPVNHGNGNVSKEYLQILRAVLGDKRLNSETGLAGSTSTHPKWGAWNLKYDQVGLRNNLDIDLFGTKAIDIMLMYHMLYEENWKDLDSAARHLIGRGKNKTEAHEAIAKAFGWEYVPVEMMAKYAINDAEIELLSYEKMLPQFLSQFDEKLLAYETKWSEFLTRVEACGIKLNYELIESEIKWGDARVNAICEELGGNPGSPIFQNELFIERLGLPVHHVSEKTGRPSFNKDAMAFYEDLLAERGDKTAELVLEYRGWTKTLSSNYRAYLELLSPDGYLRPNYKLHGTKTGRLSCEKPNLQQIPRVTGKRWNGNLKKAFIPRDGYLLWEADYSNLELRLATVYSRDPALTRIFQIGGKPFDDMASRLGWARHDCKTFTYTVLFGGGNRRVAAAFGISPSRATTMREQFFDAYPSLRSVARKAAQKAKTRGYVKMWTGRRRHFSDPEAHSHKAFNAVIQGGGAEIVKRTGLRIDGIVDWDDCRVLLQVHDSYVFEIKIGTENKWIPKIQQIMEDVGELHEDFKLVPFPVDVHQWGNEEAKYIAA